MTIPKAPKTTKRPQKEAPPKSLGLRVPAQLHDRMKRAMGRDLADGIPEGESLQRWAISFFEKYLPAYEAEQRNRKSH